MTDKHIPINTFKSALEKGGGKYGIGILNEKIEETPKEGLIFFFQVSGSRFLDSKIDQ